MRQDEIDGAYGTYREQVRSIKGFWRGNLKERDCFEDLSISGG
jgi:hypothetical protein